MIPKLSILTSARFIALHDPERALTTEDPGMETYLPVEDDDFNKGVRIEYKLSDVSY